jgi:hypothetical protein
MTSVRVRVRVTAMAMFHVKELLITRNDSLNKNSDKLRIIL